VLLVIVDRPDPKTGQLNLLPDYFFLVVGWKATARYTQRTSEALSEGDGFSIFPNLNRSTRQFSRRRTATWATARRR
jgi:hypothetical protein